MGEYGIFHDNEFDIDIQSLTGINLEQFGKTNNMINNWKFIKIFIIFLIERKPGLKVYNF